MALLCPTFAIFEVKSQEVLQISRAKRPSAAAILASSGLADPSPMTGGDFS